MNQDTTLSSSNGELVLSAAALRHLRGISKWAYFMSVAGIIMMILLIAMMLLFMAKAPVELSSARYSIGFNILLSAVYIIPLYFMFRFATLCKQGLIKQEENHISKSFGFLHQHYLFVGVVAIIGMVILVIAFLAFVFLLTSDRIPGFSA